MPLPSTINLSSLSPSQGVRILGADGGTINAPDTDRYGDLVGGVALSSAGDVNGDGIDDILISATFLNAGGTNTNEGAVYVVYGKTGGALVDFDLSALNFGATADGFRVLGPAVGGQLGSAVAGIGDVNGDGFGDFAIGASSLSPNGAYSGATYVIFGHSTVNTVNIDLASFSPTQGFRLLGAAALDNFGNSVASLGDINGDGLKDFIVGAVVADVLGRENAGAAYVIYGKTSGYADVNLNSMNAGATVNGFRIGGASGVNTGAGDYNGDRVGAGVSSAGDFNGDGISDILISANQPNGNGMAYVIYGHAAANPFTNIDLLSLSGGANATGFTISGTTANSYSGYRAVASGDVNGDGLSDLVIGVYSENGNYGAVYVVFGRTGAPANINLTTLDPATTGFKISGETNVFYGRAGFSVAAADVNGDGKADVIVGTTYNNRAYIVYGTAVGGAANVSLDSLGSQGVIINGQPRDAGNPNSSLGRVVAGGGDFNGDGFKDVLIGDPYLSAAGKFQAGAAYVVFGAGATPTISITSVTQSEATSPFAFTVSLDAPSTQTVTVNYATATGTASAADFTGIGSTTLTFAPGQLSQTVNVTVANDAIYEANETFTVNLSAPTNATIATGTGTGTINNNDTLPVFNFSSPTYSIPEGNAGTILATFTVTKTGATELTSSVNFATSDGSATTANLDYVANSGTLTFAAGETSKTFTVTINGDTTVESNETINVSLSAPTGATLGAQSTAVGTITNDDNAPPTATNLSTAETYTEDQTALDLTNIVVTDTDSANVTATLTLNPSVGSLSTGNSGAVTSTFVSGVWTASGAISSVNALLAAVTFTPVSNASGTFNLATSVSDGTSTITGTKVFTGTSVNDAPSGANATLTILEDGVSTLAAANFGFTDPNDSPGNALLAVRITTLPGAGSLTLNNVAVNTNQSISVADINSGLLQYRPVANANGTGYATIGFAVQDNGSTANSGVDLDASPNTLTFDVTAVNDAPVTVADSYSTNEDTPLVILAPGVLANDSDVDNVSIFAAVTTNPAHGALTLNSNGSFTYTPTANYNGPDSFSYRASDGNVNGNIVVVDLMVNAVNDAPVVDLNTATAGINETNLFVEGSFSSAIGGQISVTDIDGDTIRRATITITDPVTGDALNYTTPLPVGISVDPASTATTLILIGNTSAGAFQTALGQVGYTNSGDDPTLGGTDTSRTITVTVNDGTVDSATATSTITVLGVNDAPTATNLSAAESYTEDQAPFSLTDIVITDLDSAEVTATLTLSNTAAGTLSTGISNAVTSTFVNGVWTASGAKADVNALLASVSFTPAANFNSSFTIVTSVSDGVAAAVTGVKAFTGTSVNDAPAGLDAVLTINEDTPRSFTASDFGFTDPNDSPANALLGVKITTLPTAGTLTLDGYGLSAGDFVPVADIPDLVFTPALNANGTGYSTFTFQVRDNGGTTNSGADIDPNANTIGFNVTSVNDAPTGANANLSVVEGTSRVLTAADFGYSDVDGNAFTAIRVSALPGAGQLTFDADGSGPGVPVSASVGQIVTIADINAGKLTYVTPSGVNNGATNFSFQVQDNGGTADGGIDLDASPNTISYTLTPVTPPGPPPPVTIGNTTYVEADYVQPANDPATVITPRNQSDNIALNITGNAGSETIIGNYGPNILTDGGGVDTLVGLLNNDTYVVSNSGTVVVENNGEGTDTVLTSTSYILPTGASIENLSALPASGTAPIFLTGNGADQRITGNAGDNIINGLGGSDTMVGLGGNDVYLVRGPGDVVIEANGEGTDTVYTTVSYNLGANEVEVLSTVTHTDTTPINLIGNYLSQTIIGNYGDNLLNGGSGIDTLVGLFGNDLYAVGDSRIVIVEAEGQGVDTVVTSVSYTLGTDVSAEVLSAQDRSSTTGLSLTGNRFNQTIAGTEGADTINGGAGSDVLIGGGGGDRFDFTTLLGSTNVDAITDFGSGDRIGLSSAIFGGVGATLDASEFVTGSAAADADDRIVYNQSTGQIFYDADGNGAGVATLFAVVTPGTILSASNFTVIAP